MFRTSRQICVLAIALFVMAPASAMAQSGPVKIVNGTGVTLRIGGEYYINSVGGRVECDRNSFWELRPGQGGPLSTGIDPATTIKASKFVFTIITPDGESHGWIITRVMNGEGACTLDASTLNRHKSVASGNQQAGIALRYQAMTADEARRGSNAQAIANLRADIAQLEENLRINDGLIITADAAVVAAEFYLNFVANTAADRQRGRDTRNAAKAARGALGVTRGIIELNLNGKRAQLQRLLNQP